MTTHINARFPVGKPVRLWEAGSLFTGTVTHTRRVGHADDQVQVVKLDRVYFDESQMELVQPRYRLRLNASGLSGIYSTIKYDHSDMVAKGYERVAPEYYEMTVAGVYKVHTVEDLHEGMVARGYAEVGRAQDGSMVACMLSNGDCYVVKS